MLAMLNFIHTFQTIPFEGIEMIAWQIPQAALCFFALMMAILSLWIKRSPWIWGSFLLISLSIGFAVHLINLTAIGAIVALFFLHGILKANVNGIWRFLLFSLVALLSIGLWLHLIPGFNSWKINSTIFLSLDKPFIGLFILAWKFPLHTWKEKRLFYLMILLAIGIAVAIAFIGLGLKIFSWDPKIPPHFWLLIPVNLLLISVSEEGFIRGFVQREIFRFFGEGKFLAAIGSIVLSALLFSLLYIPISSDFTYLSMIFIAGIFFAAIFHLTEAIESAILAHFFVSLVYTSLLIQ
ncbi:MAG: CPBP family intramembrane metalloprotease [Chlamydiae bacterium]|nr:CPBP family intramembrane metalloprotease [Chlamydiota bacterium]